MARSVALRASHSHLWAGGVLVLLAVVCGWYFTDFVTRTGDGLERARIQSLAKTAAASLDPAKVAALRGRADEAGTPAFEQVRAELKRVHDVNRDFRFVYLMRPKAEQPDHMLFLADAEPANSPDYSAPGDVYDGPSETLFGVYRSGLPTIEPPARDRWGYWVTSLAPIKDARTGEIVAVLGMDVNADSWLATHARYRAFALVISALVVALVLLFTIGLHLQKNAATRIAAINARLAQQLAELERAQKGLKLADLVVKNTGEGILVLDGNMAVESVNPGFEEITGYVAEQVLGKTPELLASTDDDVDNQQLIRSGLHDTDQWEGTLLGRRPSGETFPMETSVDVVRDKAGAIRHYVLVFRDATAQKQLEDRLRELSATDGLTMVANRRAFDEAMEREWQRARRGNEPLSLIMADLDLFKSYNDLYGHIAGDQCLRRVAGAIAECAKRSGDLVARYGGEEFAVILPRTDEASARHIAEKIRRQVEDLGIVHAGNPAAGRITISLGISTRTPPQSADFLSLMESADQALYRAKESGRNAVAS